MIKEFFPKSHNENRMKNEGNVVLARENFVKRLNTEDRNNVLYRLLEQRYSWMNEYLKPSISSKGGVKCIEIGCGAGFSKFFLENKDLILTDVLDNEWVDEHVDALNLPYADDSLDIVIASHMIHHLASPYDFFMKLSKKIKPGGKIIIQDINTCLFMKLALLIMRHEGFSDIVDVFDKDQICNQENDPWSANCSIPKLLFSDTKKFEDTFPNLRVIYNELNECFLFFLSGGVIAQTNHFPWSDRAALRIKAVDRKLVKFAPSVFACGRSVVIERVY